MTFDDRDAAAGRSNWRRKWLTCLYEFASINVQKRSWRRGDRRWVSSPAEANCSYFDDLDLGSGYGRAVSRGLVAHSEAAAVAAFHLFLDDYGGAGELEDTDWRAVVKSARIAWTRLRSLLTDPQELELIATLEREWGRIAPPRQLRST